MAAALVMKPHGELEVGPRGRLVSDEGLIKLFVADLYKGRI